jgi:hypothetical protein
MYSFEAFAFLRAPGIDCLEPPEALLFKGVLCIVNPLVLIAPLYWVARMLVSMSLC